jgi:hypothetical protein
MNGLARLTAAAVTGLLTLSLVAGCVDTSEDDPRIPQYPAEGDGWSAMSLPHRRAGQPVIFDALFLCLDRPGAIEITEISMEHTQGGFLVEAFATRPAVPTGGGVYPQLASESQSLWDLGYQRGSNVVDKQCTLSMADTPLEHRVQVGVQFTKSFGATARGAVLRISYRSGENSYVYRLGFEAVLCEGEESVPECKAWDYDWRQSPVRIMRTAS